MQLTVNADALCLSSLSEAGAGVAAVSTKPDGQGFEATTENLSCPMALLTVAQRRLGPGLLLSTAAPSQSHHIGACVPIYMVAQTHFRVASILRQCAA